MLGLIAPSPSSGEPHFTLEALVALPVMVEAEGLVLGVNGDFRIWISGAGETTQLQISPDGKVAELETLPVVIAGAARCAGSFLVTGADRTGGAVVIGCLEDGRVAWQHALEGASPVRWPVPVCVGEPRIVWQTEHEKLNLAHVGPDGITGVQSFAVGRPPLEIADDGESIWTVWSSESGVFAMTLPDSRTLQLASSYSSQVAVARCADRTCVAYGDNSSVVLKQFARDRTPLATLAMEPPPTVRGKLALVPWSKPLVWIRGTEAAKGERLRAKSTLAIPGLPAVEIDGLVFSVTADDNRVAVLGANELLLLQI